MTIKIERNKLLEALQSIYAATGKSGAYCEQHRCFIFRAKEKSLTIEASDSELFMSKKLAIENTDYDSRDFALFAPQFIKAIKSVDEQPLELEVLEYQIIVRHNVGSFALPVVDCVPLYDNMRKPELDYSRVHRLAFEAPGLYSILNKCKYALADDDLRPVLNGVCMSLKKDYTDFAASDGHKLVRIRKQSIKDEKPVDFVFPKKVINTLLKILPKTGFVGIWFNEYDYTWKPEEHNGKSAPSYGCLMVIDGTELLFRPISGRYPNFENVIPSAFSKELTIDRKQLLKSIERLSQFANDSSRLITFNLNPTRLMMQAEDKDFATQGSEVLPCTYSGEVCRVGFKDITLIQTLRNSTAPEMIFKGIDSSKAFIIEPSVQPDSEEITMLLMPMIINDNDND